VETAKTVINDALQELLVQAIEQPIQQVDYSIAQRYLNRMMAEFAADGINLGYTEVSNPADYITVAAGAINGMIYNLALNLATTYDIAVSPELTVKADNGRRIMTRIAVTIQPSSYPDTLPIGSGNDGDSTYNDKFYSADPDTVDAESGAVIGLEQLP
jgi:hypothetical protein